MSRWRTAWREPGFWSSLSAAHLALSPVLWELSGGALRPLVAKLQGREISAWDTGYFLTGAALLLTLEIALLLVAYKTSRPEAKSLVARMGRGVYYGFTTWFFYLLGSTVMAIVFDFLAGFAGLQFEEPDVLILQMEPALLLPLGGTLASAAAHCALPKTLRSASK